MHVCHLFPNKWVMIFSSITNCHLLYLSCSCLYGLTLSQELVKLLTKKTWILISLIATLFTHKQSFLLLFFWSTEVIKGPNVVVFFISVSSFFLKTYIWPKIQESLPFNGDGNKCKNTNEDKQGLKIRHERAESITPENVPATRRCKLQQFKRCHNSGHQEVWYREIHYVIVGHGVHMIIFPNRPYHQHVPTDSQNDDNDVYTNDGGQNRRNLSEVLVVPIVNGTSILVQNRGVFN